MQLAFIVVPIESIERDGFSFKTFMNFNRTFGSSWVLRQDVLIASTWMMYDKSGTFSLICKNVHVVRTINLLNTKVIQQHHNIAFNVLQWLTRCFDAHCLSGWQIFYLYIFSTLLLTWLTSSVFIVGLPPSDKYQT